MEKIILFYKFVPLNDTEAIKLWQMALCEQLSLKGRILISSLGINGTLGGDPQALKKYTRTMKQHSQFKDIAYKWSDGSAGDFPKLSIKVRSETVTSGSLDEIQVNNQGVVDGGVRIKPQELDEFVKNNPDAILFDGRNNYESAIGKFKGAITPNVRHFKDFSTELDKTQYESLKDKKVVTYCTGGIRCETLSALMKKKGFKKVYQLDGGIVTYGETKGDQGLWEGKCFVFDRRLSVAFSEQAKDIGLCIYCAAHTSRYVNCVNKACNDLILVCENCHSDTEVCSASCLAKLQTIPAVATYE